MRWTRTAALAIAGAVTLAPALAAAPASATTYRYWTYWTVKDSSWVFSDVGPASTVPKDGDVEGWRFALSTGTNSSDAQPRISPSDAFEQFCGSTPAPSGQKRVAIVFDFGDVSDAPDGESPPPPRGTCRVKSEDATGAQILTDAADVRTDKGLVCAIGGYPQAECAPAVAPPTQSPTDEPGPDETRDSPDAEPSPTFTRQTPEDSVPATPPARGQTDSAGTSTPGRPDPGDPDGGDNGTTSSPDAPKPGDPTESALASGAPVPLPTPSPTPSFQATDARQSQPAGGQWVYAVLAAVAIGALSGWAIYRNQRAN